MNRQMISIFFYWAIVILQSFHMVHASQYDPNIYYFTIPSKDIPNLATPLLSLSAGFANEAYNKDGKLVPYLQQYGPEDFLQRFVNPLLGPDSLESAGQGLISGQYHFKQYLFSFEQNINHKLLFGAIAALQDLAITNITPEFIPEEYPLSAEQNIYLEKLKSVLPQTINQYGMNSAFFYLGYNEELTHFNHINSLGIILLLSITTPQWMKNHNNTIMQYPCAANIHFGYPVAGSIKASINDNFSFGFSGLATPFQPCYTTIPINKTSENNHLLFSQSTQAKIKQSPFISGILYIELEHCSSKTSGMIAYSYSQYLKSKIIPNNPILFPESHANKSILLDGYTLGAFLFQINFNPITDKKNVSPLYSLYFSIPVVGKLYPKTYLFGGQCAFEINYNF